MEIKHLAVMLAAGVVIIVSATLSNNVTVGKICLV